MESVKGRERGQEYSINWRSFASHIEVIVPRFKKGTCEN